MDRKYNRKAILLFVVLLFPSIVYVIFSSGKHTFLYRPILGPKSVNESGDTLYHSVSPFSFTTCDKKSITEKDLSGKIIIFGFYNTTDSLVSARMYNQMMTLHEKFETRQDFVLISLSVTNDSSSLKEACRVESEFPIGNNRWLLGTLNGDIKEFATNQLFLHVDNDSFDYKKLVLLDKARRIRAYSDALQYAETKIFEDDIKVVIAEDFIPKKNKAKNVGI